MHQILYLGVKGHVAAVAKSDGRLLWKTKLQSGFATSGDGFATLLVDGDQVFAHSYGELFCLDAATGALRWKNHLPGLGYGIASLAIQGMHSTSSPAVRRVQLDRSADAG